MVPSIIFPNLGIELGYFPKGFKVFGLQINFYGVLIALGMVLAAIIAFKIAKRTNQSTDDYFDIVIISIVCSIIGARLYYVIFSLDQYKDFWSIFNIRNGGLALYGGVIGGIVSAVIVCKVKKIRILRVLDTCAAGIPLAQAFGRWGNFFNREAYGEYTTGLFAMQIKMDEAGGVISDTMMENIVTHNGVRYIQVSPTFLYESIWCLVLFLLILAFRRYQRYNGEVLLWYAGGYALGRAWIEGLRTDSLYIGHTNIAVSQLLSVIIFAAALTLLIINRVRLNSKKWVPAFSLVLKDTDPGSKQFSAERKAAKKNKRNNEHSEEGDTE